MSCFRRIKAGRVTISIEEKLGTWSAAWGGPLAVTPDVLELLYAHAARLDPDASLLAIMPRFFEQISLGLRHLSSAGRSTGSEAELVGFELFAAGERGDVFLGVQIANDALYLFAPTDLEEA